jgi:hypothetical protein
MLENGLRTTITTPTRYDNRYDSHTLIDVILTTLTQTTITSGTISPPISDHRPIYATIHTTPPRPRRTRRKTLSRRRYEKNKQEILKDIKKALKKTEQQDKRQAATTEDRFTHMQQTMQEIIEKCEKRPRTRGKPWCSPKLRRMIRKQHRLFKRRRAQPTRANVRAHKAPRNKLRKKIKAAKKKDIQQKMKNTHNDPKKRKYSRD